MPSIRQNAYPDLLPDFRNLGVMARVLVAVNGLALAGTIYATSALVPAIERFVHAAAFLEPLLFVELIVLFALSPLLAKLPYWWGCASVVALVLALAVAYHIAVRALGLEALPSLARTLILTALVIAFILGYFRLHRKAFSPALAEARLQALQARIRPHFLFNSLNAVLSLIRRDPRRAERALEDLADLFRTLMSEPRQFVRLADEIALLERYAGLEQLRLGDRLRITWELDAAPSDALLPPLVLQPLLENAVYHGIEPRIEPGEISIDIYAARNQVHAVLRNPYEQAGDHHAGNKMALANIRERLQLHFDVEARLETRVRENMYQVHIVMPYVKADA